MEKEEKEIVVPEFYRDLSEDPEKKGLWHYVFRSDDGRKPIRTPDGKPVGPQLRLYCPAPFLKKGANVVDVVEFERTSPAPIRGCETRNFDMNDVKTKNLNNQW